MFQIGGYYHVYNRGVDKRDVFLDRYDYERFILCLKEFNYEQGVYSLFLKGYQDNQFYDFERGENLVDVVAYCLNPNHYHLLLKQNIDNGISEFMKRIGVGYTNYFNSRYQRSGSLFQGKFKRKPVESTFYLSHVSAYINGNAEIHGVEKYNKWPWSSCQYFLDKKYLGIDKINNIIKEFENVEEYEKYMQQVIKDSMNVKKEIKRLYLE